MSRDQEAEAEATEEDAESVSLDPWGRPYETDAESRMVVFWVLLPVIVAIAVGIWKAVT